jgi:hypothetical protein
LARAVETWKEKKMGKALVGVLGLVVGLIGGTIFGGSLLGGAAVGMGIGTGLSAGICSTITAAKEEGLLTDEQIAQVLSRATTDMGGTVPEDASLVNSADDCAEVMERLREAAAS